MNEEDEKWQVVWKLASLAAERCATVELGDGSGMIGVDHTDDAVILTFYDNNGQEVPQLIGAILSAPDDRNEAADKQRPVASIVFKNRESLNVLDTLVRKGFLYFDAMEDAE